MFDQPKPTYDELLAENAALREMVSRLEDEAALLRQEIEQILKNPPGGIARAVSTYTPKPSKPEREKKPRKKRSHSFVRRRMEPTVLVEHTVENCPDCGRRLEGGWQHSVREVIDIPALPVTITHHKILRRHCGVCQKSYLPKVDLSAEALGQHRIGVRLMSLIAHMRMVCRMTIRTIQAFLRSTYNLHVSTGEIVELLHAVARKGEAAYATLQAALRASPSVNADETGYRQDGVNGQAWCFCTSQVRFYTRDPSRSHEVPERVLGSDYKGVIISDFYGGYNYHLGEHQRCLAHFLRTLHELEQDHPDHTSLAAWAAGVKRVIAEAWQFQSDNPRERIRARGRFQLQLEALAKPWVEADVPHRTLARRIERFSNEMFSFVEHPSVTPDNNAAQRAIRPLVILRKVTGGTRSEDGSRTLFVLMSLFATWQLTNPETAEPCRQMLVTTSP